MTGTWMYSFVDLFGFALAFVLLAAWRTLPLFVFVAVVDRWWRGRMPARFRMALWMLVVVRMCLPFSLPFGWSMAGVLDRPVIALLDQFSKSPPVYNAVPMIDEHGKEITLYPNPLPAAEVAVASTVATATESAWTDYLAFGIIMTWLLVSAALLIRMLGANLRWAITLRRLNAIDDPAFEQALQQVARDLKMRRLPAMKEVPGLAAPAVFGWFRPVVCLPNGTAADQQLTWILRHELAHVARRDAWWLTIAEIVKTLHWFNPMAWWVTAQLRGAMEQAADEVAMRGMPETSIEEYGQLLLRYATESCGLNAQQSLKTQGTLGLLTMAAHSGLKKRIELLDCGRQTTPSWKLWAARGLLVGGVLLGLTDGRAEDETKSQDAYTQRNPNSRIESFTFNMDALQGDEQIILGESPPASLVTMDVSKVIAKAKELEPDIDIEKFLDTWTMRADRSQFSLKDGQMTAMLTPSEERTMKAMYAAFERSGAWQIVIETRIMQADESVIQGMDWQDNTILVGAHSEDSQIQTACITDDQMRRLITRMQADPRTNIMFAPKVTVFNGQMGVICSVNAVPGGDGTPLYDVAGQAKIHDGFAVSLRAEVIDAESVSVECRVNVWEPQKNDDQPTAGPLHRFADLQAAMKITSTLLYVAPQTPDEAKRKQLTLYAITPRMLLDDSEFLRSCK